MLHRMREANDWCDVLGDDARFVPEAVVPQMPDIMARALAAGAPPSLEFMGAGMTGVVFCADDIAYKVARTMKPINRSFFEDEAEWLEAASRVREVSLHVAPFYRFDPLTLVIERACPKSERSSYSYGESKLFDLHQKIERAMIPHGWSAPEYKPDSYVITTHGPVLVDASMPSRVGQVLARYVEEIVAGKRELRSGDRPGDLAFAVRREVGQTLSKAESDRLEDLIGSRWPDAVEKRVEENVMAAKKKTTKKAKKGNFDNENEVLYEVALDLDIDPDELKIEESQNGFDTGTVYRIYIRGSRTGSKEWIVVRDSDQERELAIEVVTQDLKQEPEIFEENFIEPHINTDRLRLYLESDVLNNNIKTLQNRSNNEFWDEYEQEGFDLPEEIADYVGDDPPEPNQKQIEKLAKKQTKDQLRYPMSYLKDIYGPEDAVAQAIKIAGIDVESAAEDAVDTDGPAHFLADYDGKSHETKSGFVYWRAN
jgi:hypothetical protein